MNAPQGEVQKLTAVYWYLKRDPEMYGHLESLALMEMKAAGVSVAAPVELARCGTCGQKNPVWKFDARGENLCRGCDR